MNFRRLFPAVAWLLRQLASRPARRAYITVLTAVLIPAIALRIEAMVFQFRVLKLMSGLATLRIGVTSKSEALSRIPALSLVRSTSKDYQCGADECFVAAIPNSRLSSWILLPTFRGEHRTLNSALQWWGFRYWGVEASVDFTSGKVSLFGYRLMLSPVPSSYPDAIVISVWSRNNFPERQLSWDVDESPNYVVYHGRKWPDLNTGIYFTRDTTPELLGHAFDLHLHCLWLFAGCQTANQLLPLAEEDRLEIRRAAIERLKGPNQCPLRILPGRARDAEDILLVNVRDVGPTITESDGGTYRMVNFRLLRVLKGKPQRPLENIPMYSEIYLGEVSVHNSAYDLLRPGRCLVLFSEASSCEAMDGSDNSVQIIETTLAPSP
ncbi:MAG: hypothetical protein ACLQBK_13225 [Candidatus Sulfotelmatobacter sp.]